MPDSRDSSESNPEPTGEDVVLRWSGGGAQGPRGLQYMIQIEHVRGEGAWHSPYVWLPDADRFERIPVPMHVAFGNRREGTKAYARAACEWHARSWCA